MDYKHCATKEDFLAAQAEYRKNHGRWTDAPSDQDAYMDSLAGRMALAAAKLGQAVEVRIK